MKLGAASIALAFAVTVPAALEATPITITFTGTPTLKKGVFGSETADIVFGSFTYDSDAVDSKKGPKEDNFVSNLFGNDANVVWGFEVTLGRTTRSLFSGKSTKFRLKLKDGSKKSGKGKKSGKSKKNDAYSFRSGAGGIKLQLQLLPKRRCHSESTGDRPIHYPESQPLRRSRDGLLQAWR